MNTPVKQINFLSDYPFFKIPDFRQHNIVYKILFKEDNKIYQVFQKKINLFWNNIYILLYINTVVVGYIETPKC